MFFVGENERIGWFHRQIPHRFLQT